MGPKSNNILIKACLLLTITLTTNSSYDTYESISIDSGEESIEDRKYQDNEIYMNLKGSVRKSMAYSVVQINTRKSIVCSPLSSILALGKLAIGSSSRRYQELKDATGYKRHKVNSRLKNILLHLSKLRSSVKLLMFSRMYVSHTTTLRSKFDSAARSIFKSSCEKVDFDDPKRTARTINDMISYETHGLIKNLVTQSEIKPTCSLIMLSVVYFKGNWRHSFDLVKREAFYAPGKPRHITMLTRQGYYNYVKSNYLKAQVVEVPYQGEDVRLIIVLPFELEGLPALLRNLERLPEGLNSVLSQMTRTKLKLSIPQFRVYSDLPMDAIYKKIGLREVFKTNNKILTKIVKGQKLHLTRTYQTVVFEVDRHGSDGGIIDMAKMPAALDVGEDKRRTHFLANRPFYFIVLAIQEQLFASTYTGT